jgi:choline dehydrogenase-like flavoprotein
VGLAVALGCVRRGLKVLLLEAGDEAAQGAPADLWDGLDIDPSRHARPDVATCRALGGTSHWWGGRCVPLDAVDLELRGHVLDASWPIGHGELAVWSVEAAQFLGIGAPHFETVAPDAAIAADPDLRFADLERWTPERNIARVHRDELAASTALTMLLQASVFGLVLDEAGDCVAELQVADADGATARIAVRRLVLACGGIETTRLLLDLRRRHPQHAVLRTLPIGQRYMGHMSGKIASLVLDAPERAAEHDFFLDDGVYARRRLTLSREAQRRERLLNISFWADNPPFHDAAHRSALLSLVWIALAIPTVGRRLVSEGVRLAHVGPGPHRFGAHLRNVLASPFAALADVARVLRSRYLARPRKPGFLLRNRAGRYALHFHAEQSPNAFSSLKLADTADALGLPQARVEIGYLRADAERIVRAHEVLDAGLRRCGLGRLDYRQADRDARIDAVFAMASDGFHQIGGARMGRDPATSVVDGDAAVHGVANLFVASTAVFCSSGQANPTFSAVALALRLADHLSRLPRASTADSAPALGAQACSI